MKLFTIWTKSIIPTIQLREGVNGGTILYGNCKYIMQWRDGRIFSGVLVNRERIVWVEPDFVIP